MSVALRLRRIQWQFQKLSECLQVAFAAEVIDVVVICAVHDIELLWLIGRCVKGIRVLHRDLLIAVTVNDEHGRMDRGEVLAVAVAGIEKRAQRQERELHPRHVRRGRERGFQN